MFIACLCITVCLVVSQSHAHVFLYCFKYSPLPSQISAFRSPLKITLKLTFPLQDLLLVFPITSFKSVTPIISLPLMFSSLYSVSLSCSMCHYAIMCLSPLFVLAASHIPYSSFILPSPFPLFFCSLVFSFRPQLFSSLSLVHVVGGLKRRHIGEIERFAGITLAAPVHKLVHFVFAQ